MPIIYTDTHAHLTSEKILPHVDDVVERARLAGVHKIVNICTDTPSLQAGLALHEKYPWIYNTAATTPHDVDVLEAQFFPLVAQAAHAKKLIAIGETGLDYFYAHSAQKNQQEALLRYFELAKQTNLPLIFHCRDAFTDLFALADAHYPNGRAVLHCFTGTLGEAKQVLDRGWFLSLSGIVTFKKSESLKEVAKFVPLDQLFIETDTPYLAPQGKRGKQNEPAFVVETAEYIAQLRGISSEIFAQVTTENAERFFSFSKVN